MEVIAVRGDHLALCEVLFVTAAGDEFRVLSLCKSTDDGTAIRATTFDPHQLDEALDELDRQWIQLGGPRQNVELGAAIVAALRRGDVDQVRLMLTDDYVDIDHRPLGMGRRTADEWLASLPQQDDRHDAVRIVALVVAHTDDTSLTRSVLSDGTDDVRWEFWSIGQRIGDLAARNETFAIDDYAAAKARYDELVTTDAPRSLRRTTPAS